jgi:hypothetical protein
MAKFIDITTDPNAFLVSPDPSGTNDVVAINKSLIATISGVYGQRPQTSPGNPSAVPVTADADSNYWIYPYDTRTIINIVLNDGRRESIELQEVVAFTGGTAGWDAGTQSALNTAIADLSAAL